MPSEASKRIDEIIATSINPILKPRGYRKLARSFSRNISGLYQVISFQSDVSSSEAFTVNLSLTFSCFHQAWTGQEFPKNPGSSARILSWRLGILPSTSSHDWYPNTQSDSVKDTAEKVSSDLLRHGLPWLETWTGLQQIVDHLMKHDTPQAGVLMNGRLCCAIVLHCLNRTNDSQTLLKKMRDESKFDSDIEVIDLVTERLFGRQV